VSSGSRSLRSSGGNQSLLSVVLVDYLLLLPMDLELVINDNLNTEFDWNTAN